MMHALCHISYDKREVERKKRRKDGEKERGKRQEREREIRQTGKTGGRASKACVQQHDYF